MSCAGLSIEGYPEDSSTLDLHAIRATFDSFAAARKGYLPGVSDQSLTTVLAIPIRHKPIKLARWQLLAQSLIHSTHHRGELSIVMTALGCPLPTLDPIIQCMRDSGQSWD